MTNHPPATNDQTPDAELPKPKSAENLALKAILTIGGAIARFAEDTIKEREMFRDIPRMD